MNSYRLKCTSCDYESNPAPFGTDVWSPELHIPVYVPDDETLHSVSVDRDESESEESFFNRVDATLIEVAAKEFGSTAVCMQALAVKGGQLVVCPRCKKELAKFEFAGF